LRLDAVEADALRFAHDFHVPFSNNLAERDIRMVKLQLNVSGCWRTDTGAQRYLKIRSYISTAREQGHGALAVLNQLTAANPGSLRQHPSDPAGAEQAAPGSAPFVACAGTWSRTQTSRATGRLGRSPPYTCGSSGSVPTTDRMGSSPGRPPVQRDYRITTRATNVKTTDLNSYHRA